MEFKSISVLMTMMILFIHTANADMKSFNPNADAKKCIFDCADKCPTGDDLCFLNCLQDCLKQPQTPLDPHYYCNLGCSSSQCLKFSNDKLKMGDCVDHCADRICKTK
ncbi:hypothetical protein ABKV19_012483 [Rosa sericea]